MVIKRCLIKQWTLKGDVANINKVFNTDSNNVANYSKNWGIGDFINFLNFVGSLHELLEKSKEFRQFPFLLVVTLH